MGENVDRLTAWMELGGGYEISAADLRETQIAAMNERLQEQGHAIKLVAMRAKDAGITEISELADAVQLLLPHTAFKNYPESFLTDKRWDRLTRWLATVSAHPTDNVDPGGPLRFVLQRHYRQVGDAQCLAGRS